MPPFMQKYLPDKIDVEQVILQNVSALQMTFFSAVDLWDATKYNSMFVAGVMNLDALVAGILGSIDNQNTKTFKEKRKAILDKWKNAPSDKSPIDQARELYILIIDTLNREGVFKFRRMAYFGVGWKKRKESEIEASLQAVQEAELDDENWSG